MNRSNIVVLIAVAVTSVLVTFLLLREYESGPAMTADPVGDDEHADGDAVRGPHGGRLLAADGFSIELVIVESGVPPEFHLYAYENGEPVRADEVSAKVELVRLGEIRDTFSFAPEGDYLRGIERSRLASSSILCVTGSSLKPRTLSVFMSVVSNSGVTAFSS